MWSDDDDFERRRCAEEWRVATEAARAAATKQDEDRQRRLLQVDERSTWNDLDRRMQRLKSEKQSVDLRKKMEQTMKDAGVACAELVADLEKQVADAKTKLSDFTTAVAKVRDENRAAVAMERRIEDALRSHDVNISCEKKQEICVASAVADVLDELLKNMV